MKVLNRINKKQKSIGVILILCVIFTFTGGYLYKKYNSLNNKVVRFHVLANSDTNIDQSVKLKVKDSVIKYVQPLLENSESLDESKSILNHNKEKIIKIANKVLAENGQVYTASAELGKFDFPVKSYGDIVFPSGEYEAFRIVLGEGEGKNWWCVMFPPLCFVDTKNAIAEEEMEKKLEKVLTKEEIQEISQNKEKAPKLKLKSAEFINKLFN